MKEFIREIEPGVELYRDNITGIAWAEDHRVGLGVSVHPNIDETGSVEGMVSRGWWRAIARRRISGLRRFGVTLYLVCESPSPAPLRLCGHSTSL